MTRNLRSIGVALIALGIVAFLVYVIPPIRGLWPIFLRLPLPVQLSIGLILIGSFVILSALLIERFQERDYDRTLRDDESPL